MPETKKGKKIKKNMEKFYGKKKGDQVFYASINAGKLKGVHGKKKMKMKMKTKKGTKSGSRRKR